MVQTATCPALHAPEVVRGRPRLCRPPVEHCAPVRAVVVVVRVCRLWVRHVPLMERSEALGMRMKRVFVVCLKVGHRR